MTSKKEQHTENPSHHTRLQQILAQLEESDYISVKTLSQALKVSEVTIRKDLTFLEDNGYLYRTHGGATKKSYYAFEETVGNKENIHTKEKQEITKKAMEYIDENDFIILASGTTMHYLARNMQHFKKLTVLTASLRVALELCNASGVQVIQMGGEVRKSSTSVIGTFSETILSQFSCNKLFLGIDGISVDFGISTSNLAEASLNQQMINSAEKIYVLGDSSKVGKRGFGKICELDKIDYFITDNRITQQQIQHLENAGISVIIS